MFEILEHTADIGFRARGATARELFENAALALVSIAVEAGGIEAKHPYPIAVNGEDRASLLVNWLSEVLYWLDGCRVALGRFEVDEITEGRVVGKGYGEPRDSSKHPPKLVVKGVTYHQLKVGQDSEGWFAEVYLDI